MQFIKRTNIIDVKSILKTIASARKKIASHTSLFGKNDFNCQIIRTHIDFQSNSISGIYDQPSVKFLSHQVIVFARHSIGSFLLVFSHGVKDIRINRSFSCIEKKNVPRAEIVCVNLMAVWIGTETIALPRRRSIAMQEPFLKHAKRTRRVFSVAYFSLENVPERVRIRLHAWTSSCARNCSYANLLNFTRIKADIFSMSFSLYTV